MLRINLLPPERRRLRRTPLYALLPLTLGVMLVAGSSAMAAYFWVLKAAIDKDIEATEALINSKQHVRAKHQQLTNDLAKIRADMASINQIVKTEQPKWSEILRALVEVSSKNPTVWFDKIDILNATSASAALRRFSPQARQQPLFGIQLDCNVAPEKLTEEGKISFVGNPELIMKFREDLKSHPAIKEAFKEFWPVHPDWQSAPEQGANEGFKLKFSVFLISVK
jgi:FtsZ-binding cell division protein ZapB